MELNALDDPNVVEVGQELVMAVPAPTATPVPPTPTAVPATPSSTPAPTSTVAPPTPSSSATPVPAAVTATPVPAAPETAPRGLSVVWLLPVIVVVGAAGYALGRRLRR